MINLEKIKGLYRRTVFRDKLICRTLYLYVGICVFEKAKRWCLTENLCIHKVPFTVLAGEA